MDEMTSRMVEITNRIGQLETNISAERTARFDAEHHAQTCKAQLQTLTRNPTSQAQAQQG